MSSDSHDAAPMVKIYKKLFLYLSIITLFGITVAVLHLPLWVILLIGSVLIVSKSLIVFESLKHLLVGRNLIVMVFLLTAIFASGMILMGIFDHKSYIVGTVDTSKQLMMEEHQEEHQGEAPHGH